ncbi:MAG: helix-turn-helix transcriptional regulator [Deltaproteobacteria bacterium]
MLAQLTRPQLAAMAGVAPSTIGRIENGEMDPSLGTLERILSAAGFRPASIEQVSDPAAVAAARGIIENDQRLLGYPGSATWAQRWKAAGFVTADGKVRDPAILAFRAGMAARLAARPGICSYARSGSWLDIARRIFATGCSWAATGGAAANRLLRSADAYWPVFYVDDPAAVAAAAGFAPSFGGGQPVLSLIPFDGVADVGVEVDADGLRWTAPLQVVIDCFGGTGRMPEQAEAITELWEVGADAR